MSLNRVARTSEKTVILIVEAMHLGRGKNSTTLTRLKNGEADTRSIKYVVANLDLKTESGGTAMRAEVAKQTRVLINEHKPNQLFLAVDYNEGASGGECTLADLTQYVINLDDKLRIPPVILDNTSFRASLSEVDLIELKRQYKTKEIVLLEYVLYGGNLAQLNAACDEYGKGVDSHWLRWQSKLRVTAFRRAPTLGLRAESAPPTGACMEQANAAAASPVSLEGSNQTPISTLAGRSASAVDATTSIDFTCTSISRGSQDFAASGEIQKIIKDSNQRGSLRNLCNSRTPSRITLAIQQLSIQSAVTLLATTESAAMVMETTPSPFSFGGSPQSSPESSMLSPSPIPSLTLPSRALMAQDSIAEEPPGYSNHSTYPAYHRSLSSPLVPSLPKLSQEMIANMPPMKMMERDNMRLKTESYYSNDAHTTSPGTSSSQVGVVAPAPIRLSSHNFRLYRQSLHVLTEKVNNPHVFFGIRQHRLAGKISVSALAIDTHQVEGEIKRRSVAQ